MFNCLPSLLGVEENESLVLVRKSHYGDLSTATQHETSAHVCVGKN